MKLVELIKENSVSFSHLRKNVAYYNISYNNETFVFTVPLDDIGDGTLLKEDKAILFMRWIKKSLDSNELVKV